MTKAKTKTQLPKFKYGQWVWLNTAFYDNISCLVIEWYPVSEYHNEHFIVEIRQGRTVVAYPDQLKLDKGLTA